jgi:hypothetical protein
VNRYSLSRLSDEALTRDLATVVAHERAATVDVLAHIAEFDTRKLYVPAGYPSMFLYSVHVLRLSEDAAYKRIKAARAARRFPAIFAAVHEGRLHLSAVVLLAPYLTEDTAHELLSSASHKTKSEIERDLAHRFPRPDIPTCVAAIPPAVSTPLTVQQAPGPVETLSSIAPHAGLGPGAEAIVPFDTGPSPATDPPRFATPPLAPPPACERQRVMPIAPGRFAVKFTMGHGAHDKLRYAEELLSHQLPSGDIAAIFERALDALIPQLEKATFAATDRPHPGRRRNGDTRTIPADVMRAVWERDQGQCTFVSESGHRCQARKFIEFDHVLEFARGGEATIDGIRLLCHAHNQHQAERTFGAEFMRHKRIAAKDGRPERQRAAMKHAS